MNTGRALVAWWLVVITLTAATLAGTLIGAWQMQIKSRQPPPVADVADQTAARQAATQTASTGTVKLLSYSADTLDQDFSAATAMLTGDFLAYYRKFTNDIVRPAAQNQGLTTSATVKRAGVATLSDKTAMILVFVNQTTTTKEKPSPATASSSVLVSLVMVNGKWLINQFNPV